MHPSDGPGDTFELTTGDNVYINVEESSILFDFGTGGGGGPYAPEGHFILFEDLDFSPGTTIVGLTFTTDVPGFDASRLLFGSDLGSHNHWNRNVR